MDPLIGAAIAAAQAAPQDWVRLPPGLIVRLLRGRLSLEQWKLAHRVGRLQSFVSKAERGADVRLSTLRRLFDAMECDLVVLPQPRRPLEELARANRLEELERRRNLPW